MNDAENLYSFKHLLYYDIEGLQKFLKGLVGKIF